MWDPRQRCDIRRVRHGLCNPSAGINGSNSEARYQYFFCDHIMYGAGNYRSSRVITVGPLFSKIDSSEWIPTTSSVPSWRACSIAPACPGIRIRYLVSGKAIRLTLLWSGESNRDERSPSSHLPKFSLRGFQVRRLPRDCHLGLVWPWWGEGWFINIRCFGGGRGAEETIIVKELNPLTIWSH